MNEHIKIDGFLFLSKIDLPIRRYNIIIGPQGAGKSVVSRLITYCRECIGNQLADSLFEGESKADFNKRLVNLFHRHFPKYSWEKTDFTINYEFENTNIIISNKNNRLFITSETLSKKRAEILKIYKKATATSETPPKSKYASVSPLFKVIREQHPVAFTTWHYIPATRSIFSIFERWLFSILETNIETGNTTIDPLLSNFGNMYSFGRYNYDTKEEKTPYQKKMESMLEEVIGGKFCREKRDEWVQYNNGRKIKIPQLSSGQQESLPIFLILLSIQEIIGKGKSGLIIEEPESHLFPDAQKRIMDAFALLYNTVENSKIFITTHSPYILSSLNNQILGYAVHKKHPKDKNILKIISDEYVVNPDDISAHYMEGGRLISIFDKETQLIDFSKIDNISDKLNLTFDKLLEFYDD